MKVSVIGFAGFIASHLADELLFLNYHVIGMDNFSTRIPNFIEKVDGTISYKIWHSFFASCYE